MEFIAQSRPLTARFSRRPSPNVSFLGCEMRAEELLRRGPMLILLDYHPGGRG